MGLMYSVHLHRWATLPGSSWFRSTQFPKMEQTQRSCCELLASMFILRTPYEKEQKYVTDHSACMAMVVKTAVMGKAGAGEGDTLDDPTTRLEYGRHA